MVGWEEDGMWVKKARHLWHLVNAYYCCMIGFGMGYFGRLSYACVLYVVHILFGRSCAVASCLSTFVICTCRQVTTEQGLLFARRHSCSSFYETSAKTGYNVRDAINNAVLKTEQVLWYCHCCCHWDACFISSLSLGM